MFLWRTVLDCSKAQASWLLSVGKKKQGAGIRGGFDHPKLRWKRQLRSAFARQKHLAIMPDAFFTTVAHEGDREH